MLLPIQERFNRLTLGLAHKYNELPRDPQLWSEFLFSTNEEPDSPDEINCLGEYHILNQHATLCLPCTCHLQHVSEQLLKGPSPSPLIPKKGIKLIALFLDGYHRKY